MQDTLTHGGISIEIIAHRKPERKDGELEWCPLFFVREESHPLTMDKYLPLKNQVVCRWLCS